MSSGMSESDPVMPDVRATQFEARRTAAILQWPLYLTATVVGAAVIAGDQFAMPVVRDFLGSSSGDLIVVGVLGVGIVVVFLMIFFRQRFLRAFLGAQTPMVLEDIASRPGISGRGAQRRIIFVTGVLAGGVIGFVATNLLGNEGERPFPISSCLVGGCIAATLNAWARTQLWEFLLSSALQIMMLGYLQTVRMVDSRASSFFCGIAVVSSCVCGISFFLRWRRWLGSLPPTVTTEEA